MDFWSPSPNYQTYIGLKFDKRWPSDWGVVFENLFQKILINGQVVILVDMNNGDVGSL